MIGWSWGKSFFEISEDGREQVLLRQPKAADKKLRYLSGIAAGKTSLRSPGTSQNVTGITDKCKPCGCQLHRSCGADKKPGIQLCFQRMDLMGYGRLGNMQLFRGTCKIQIFGYCKKTFQLNRIHNDTSFLPIYKRI